jgi:hypothetical protein
MAGPMNCGFILRQRKLTDSNFIKTLLFGWLQNNDPSVEALARAGFGHGLTITEQGVDKHSTEKADTFSSSAYWKRLWSKA